MSAPIRWTVVPLSTPSVLRRCARCNDKKIFRSSDRFRVNASGRSLDIWLIYKCEHCNQTWNATILSRVSPESMPTDLYQRFMDNDEATAWQYAFDFDALKKNDVEVDPKVETRVEGPELDWSLDHGPLLCLEIESKFPGLVRLETLLAGRLGVLRRSLTELHAQGHLRIQPDHKDPLSRKIKGLTVVELDVPPLLEARRLALEPR